MQRLTRRTGRLGTIGRACPAWAICRSLIRGTVVLALASGLSLVRPVGAQAPTLLYPDLRALPPAPLVIQDSLLDDGSTHHLLRFTTTIWNAGRGPLELRGDSSQGTTVAYQRAYDETGTVTEWPVGEFVFHRSHQHWHFENFADYELWPKREYDAWIASGRQVGQPRWRGSKTTGQGESFCVRDSWPIEDLASSPPHRTYNTCERELQGISVGWGDTYPYSLPEQWIDLNDQVLPDGRYVLRVVADRQNLLRESADGNDLTVESPQANEAVTVFKVRGTRIKYLANGPAGDFEIASLQPPTGSPQLRQLYVPHPLIAPDAWSRPPETIQSGPSEGSAPDKH
jgi:hypothetical protein